ncbi:MAG: threonine--tRNA ligase [Chitinispirillales bacterium]|nr:threonine--tRNA ligase [Chitinispirillales bacterium]
MVVFLSDGSRIEIADGSSVADCATNISLSLSKNALAGVVNEKTVDLNHKLFDGDRISILTFDDDAGKEIFWHSSSHLLAQAVQELYPNAKIAVGPAIENGFYYDFGDVNPFTPQDLEAIEKKMMEISTQKKSFERSIISRKEAKEYFEQKGEKYKIELLEENIQGDPSFYEQGDWKDMCRGPHLPNTGYIKAVKLFSTSSAHWRPERHKDNPVMMQRIYGISFPKKKDLDDYITLIEEAKKRDHRKLGKELDLFSFHDEGIGFPFWHTKGMVIYDTVAEYSRKEHLKHGYGEVKTPAVLSEELWHKSGHWDKYKDNMYFVEIDERPHAIKPMNCPGGLLIYKNSIRSYRDLPIRNFEFGLVHRHEKSSVLHGLFRVRQFTQDDAHIFCTPLQIEEEINNVIEFIFDVYKTMGFNDFFVELSTKPQNYIGEDSVWEIAEKSLQNVLENRKINYKLNPGDGAFYGPKIDFHIRDCLKRSWQCGTIQLDFSMPMRFELEYTDSDGQKKCPVMIHRALLGSMERFIGILLEHYAGFLPLWLAPVQVKVMAVSDTFMPFAENVFNKLKSADIRVEIDARNEKIGFKIRDAETHKIPYMLIIGEREQNDNSISVRLHGKGDAGQMKIDEFIAKLQKQISEKSGYDK